MNDFRDLDPDLEVEPEPAERPSRKGALRGSTPAIMLPTREADRRKELMAAARKGNKHAIRVLAEEFHLRLIPVNATSN